jgi:penicillin-binding protein 1C
MPWLDSRLRRQGLPPAWSAECRTLDRSEGSIAITGLGDGARIRRTARGDVPRARLEVRGSDGDVNWMVNGRLVARQNAAAAQTLEFPDSGKYDITAFDNQGHYDRISVIVEQ